MALTGRLALLCYHKLSKIRSADPWKLQQVPSRLRGELQDLFPSAVWHAAKGVIQRSFWPSRKVFHFFCHSLRPTRKLRQEVGLPDNRSVPNDVLWLAAQNSSSMLALATTSSLSIISPLQRGNSNKSILNEFSFTPNSKGPGKLHSLQTKRLSASVWCMNSN